MRLLASLHDRHVGKRDGYVIRPELVGTRREEAEKRHDEEDAEEIVDLAYRGPVACRESAMPYAVPHLGHEGMIDAALEIALDVASAHRLAVHDDLRVGMGNGDGDALGCWSEEGTPAERDEHGQRDETPHTSCNSEPMPIGSQEEVN